MTAMTAEPIGDAALAEVVRLAEGATRGPWYKSGSPWFSTGSLVLAGSPDRHAGHIIVDTDPMDCREEVPDGVLSDPDDDAAYIAAANPATVLALVREIRELRAKVEARIRRIPAAPLSFPGVRDATEEHPTLTGDPA